MFNEQQQQQNAAMLQMDMQREEVLGFFRDYWKPVVGFAVFLVLLTAGLQIYRGADADRAATETAAMMPLVMAPDTIANAKALEQFAQDKATGKRQVLAQLYAAGKYQAANDVNEMKRVLTEIMNSRAPDAMRDYARILLANSGSDAALDEVEKKSAWYPAAMEWRALTEKDRQKRREIYAEIAQNTGAPAAMRKRAAEFSGQALE
jgi:hypothetical protein